MQGCSFCKNRATMYAFIFCERQKEWIAVYVKSILKYKSANFTDQGILYHYVLGLFLKDFVTFLFSRDPITPEYNFKLHLKRTVLCDLGVPALNLNAGIALPTQDCSWRPLLLTAIVLHTDNITL